MLSYLYYPYYLSQLNLTPEQLQFIRTWLDPVIIPVLFWIVRRSAKGITAALQRYIAEMNAQNIMELQMYIDKKFKEHESAILLQLGLAEPINTVRKRKLTKVREAGSSNG